MREPLRERNPPKENPEPQWQIVTKKKPKHHPPQGRRTCFINYLPLPTTNSEISRIFKPHGYIEFIYIPVVKEHRNHKFAFVQFKFPQSLLTAIRDVHGQRMGQHRIAVHAAKYDKKYPLHDRLPFHHLPPPPPQKPKDATSPTAS